VRTLIATLIATIVCATACGSGRSQAVATPAPISADAIRGAALTPSDMGTDWTQKSDAAINTVQIGGRIGATNISNPGVVTTTAFEQKSGSGFVSDSVFLMATPGLARSVIAAHEQAAATTTWTQTRTEGGHTDWKISGLIAGLNPPIGDQMFATRMHADISDAKGAKTARSVEYVVFRVGRVVAFVVAQDTGAAVFARKLETKVRAVA